MEDNTENTANIDTIDKVVSRYNKNIYDRYKSLIELGITKEEYTNNHLCKIFEYYSCIQLMKEYNQMFLEYDDIKPEFKEFNGMSRTDTGIDACNLIDTIVQCKLRKDNLTWRECGTFFGSQNIFNEELKEVVVRWKKMIITRNKDCNLSKHLSTKHKLFIDKDYDKIEMISYCEELVKNTDSKDDIKEYMETNNSIVLRDYQLECIKLIKDSVGKNVVINLPTGTGKNLIILYSMKEKTKYLILVPRIILMEQIKDELKRYFPKLSRSVQCIGDGNDIYNEKKNICICVYNSISVIKDYMEGFEKIFIDEAHHIKKPEIYQEQEEEEQDLENPARKNIEKHESGEEEEEDEKNEEIDDDSSEDNLSYISTIALLSKYNNNVYLSATIDKQDGFEYYSKDIREMIEKGYLCDYTIHIPIFSEDPTNKNICKNLIKNYHNVIIYCNSQKEGKAINTMMNSILKGSSQYIDCKTNKKQRDIIIKKYKDGVIPFLVNVRILVEGFDAPITKGICFMHLPSSSTTLIQIIGRALRLHKDKRFANILLPFSNKGDETSICRFLNVIAKNDSRIRKSYEDKKLGGYINIDVVEEDDDSDDDEVYESRSDIELKFNMVFDSMGKITNCNDLWNMRLEEVKKYIDENGKRPSSESLNKDVKFLGGWILDQNKNYNKKDRNMKNINIYIKWTEFINSDKYKTYFQSNYESFIMNLNKVKQYIDDNKKRPSHHNNDDNNKFLGEWISSQVTNYKKKQQNMKDDKIYNKWTEFINSEKYTQYFILPTMEEEFITNLNKLKIYIDENNKRPSQHSEEKKIKFLGEWISTIQKNYNKKQKNMKGDNIYNTWTEFINSDKYNIYFQSQYEYFIINLNKLKIYINENRKKPQRKDKDENIKVLGNWMNTEIINYNKKQKNMKDENIYNKWTEFINNEKYKKYFLM
jgi:hypothetical protein